MDDASRKRLLRRLGAFAVYAVLAFFVYRTLRDLLGDGVPAGLRLTPALLGMSWAALLAYYLAFVLGLRLTMSALGADMGSPRTFALSFASNLGKYVPGGIWPVVGRLALARRVGLPRRVAAVGMVLENALSVAGGMLVFLASLALGAADAGEVPWAYVAPAALVFVGLYPAVFRRVLALAFRLARVEGEPPALGFGVTVALTLYYAGTWLIAGLAFRLFVASLYADAPGGLLAYSGIYAAAVVAGLVVLFAPGGIGVREAVLIALLTPLVGPATAGIAGVSARLWTTLPELALSAAALALLRLAAPPAEGGETSSA